MHNISIAVVSMSGVFPGALGAKRFWANICARKSAVVDIPAYRPDIWRARLCNPSFTPDKTYSTRAALVLEPPALPDQIDIQPDIANSLDPLHQWVIYGAWDALSRTTISRYKSRLSGIILAAIALPTGSTALISGSLYDYEVRHSLGLPSRQVSIQHPINMCGRVVSSPASLVSRVFNLKGPCYTLDAACASSLYAVKLACDELIAGRADVMLAGGVSGADLLYTQIGFSQLKALSASGRCAPFDHKADGLVVGEGAGIVVLKRLEDAIRDQDCIYGVIQGIGLSNDMRGNLLAPESAGQMRAMRAAYHQAGWKPEDVQYIECHGAGTRVGDATELASLCALWQDRAWTPAQCAIGSVKSMVGHLLTGAGAAGLIKTLLGLHHKTLPPSLNFNKPADDSLLSDSPFKVQTQADKWPAQADGKPRRAAVSAFGFGGINAHILLEESPPKHDETPTAPSPIKLVDHQGRDRSEIAAKDIAVVGMDACLGSLDSLAAFQHALFNGACTLRKAPAGRWRFPNALASAIGQEPPMGGFFENIACAMGEFQIPPGEIPDILPQQLLMLKTAANAIHDAGLPLREPRETMGTVIGIAYDYEATNFHLRWRLPDYARQWKVNGLVLDDQPAASAWLETVKTRCGPGLTATRTLGALGGMVASRIAREFRLGAPSFVVSAEEASGLHAITIAMRLLQSGEADSMLVGAVDLFCDERNLSTVFTRIPLSKKNQIRPFDEHADGTLPGEGAVALVLKRLTDAVEAGDRIYGVIKGSGSASGGDMAPGPPSAQAYILSMTNAFESAKIAPETMGLMEVHGSGIPDQDDVESQALADFFEHTPLSESKSIAIGTTKPLIGHTGAVSGLASMVKALLSLHHKIIAPAIQFKTPRMSIWNRLPLHFPHQASPWIRDRADGPRTACVGVITSDGGCMHMVLQQAPQKKQEKTGALAEQTARPMGPLNQGLFIVSGSSKTDLMEQLTQLKTMVVRQGSGSGRVKGSEAEHLARSWFKTHLNRPRHKGFVLSILAQTQAALLTCIEQARRAVDTGSSLKPDRKGGVCYLPGAATQNTSVTFVYPGSGNHAIGMGSTLGAHWPDIVESMDEETEHLRFQTLPHLYQPWRSNFSDGWKADAYAALVADPLHTIFGQVVFGSHMTRLLSRFNIHPNAVIGYSLGESTGFFATGAWSAREEMLKRLAASDLFKTQLTGEFLSVRQAWGLGKKQPVQWRVAAVNRNTATVDRTLAEFTHLRRLIVNTPDECVIGGLREELEAAIDQMRCEAVYLDGVVSVHCDAARPVAQAYKNLHLFPTKAPEGIRYYSCAWEKAYTLTADKAAQSILDQALTGFDFPRTIRQAHKDGSRIFLEIGPHSSCTRMISRILVNQPHLAVAAHSRSENECDALLKCLATLAAAGVNVNLHPLYGYSENHFRTMLSAEDKEIRVPVGGPPLKIEPPETVLHRQATLAPAREEEPWPQNDSSTDTAPEHAENDFETFFRAFDKNIADAANAHEQFLDLSRDLSSQYADAVEMQFRLLHALAGDAEKKDSTPGSADKPEAYTSDRSHQPVAFTREQCMEFAIGSVGKVLGPDFAIIDTYPARVRLPDEPLMLVDRILLVEGEKQSLGPGRVVTEHDVRSGAWYLDGGRAPVCISVEAGQADLFLSGYLGIDHQVKGQRTYRLLDARIVFHRSLPKAGEMIRYDIHIDKFVKQGQTYLFFFRFEGYIGDSHLITMTDGCAGFFTEEEVRNSGGILLTEADLAYSPKIGSQPFRPVLPFKKTTLPDDAIEALRRGDAGACFGEAFSGITLPSPLRLPAGRMHLINRVLELDPQGGRFGLGYIKAEADIHPDDWFLTCHFVDDRVMPGTLMYECCAHTLRVFLLSMGWVTEQETVCYEPVQGVPCRLKCRGPVTPSTRNVHYAVELKEIGYHPEPYVIADAHMHADGRYIVFFKDMSMQLSGVNQAEIETFWQARANGSMHSGEQRQDRPWPKPEKTAKALFTREHILAFAVGRPSEAYGEPYTVFDEQRVIARLPGPPYCFIDRITHIEPEPWVLQPGGWIEAQHDVPADAWYFGADRSGEMPFCVLLEIALQPCGWLAAYLGSALKSETDLKFRNLGGDAVQHAALIPESKTLTMRTRLTKLSEAADMIIEHFDFEVLDGNNLVYSGNTYFGFFTAKALSQQVGLREAAYSPAENELNGSRPVQLEDFPPLTPKAPAMEPIDYPGLLLPAKALRMIDNITAFNPNGGPHGLGFIRGIKHVDPDEWFFKAHFFQDPVCPGSLGVESFLQLIKYYALQRWPQLQQTHRFHFLLDVEHHWAYRGQVIPSNHQVVVDAVITQVEEGPEPVVRADGWLHVDGLLIYKMEGFGFRLVDIQQ